MIYYIIFYCFYKALQNSQIYRDNILSIMQIILKPKISKQSNKNLIIANQKLSSNKLYVLQCKANLFKLRSQPKTYRFKLGQRLKITGNKLEYNFMNHLWILNQVKQNKQNMGAQYYEIVHYKTDLVMTIMNNQVVLDEGESKSEQLFEIIINKDGFARIKDMQGNNVQLDGVLQLSDVHQKDDTSLFSFIPYNLFEPSFLKDTVLISSNQKDAQSFDLMNGGRQGQKDIILYKVNNRINQRWKFVILDYSKQKDQYQVYIKSTMIEESYVVYDSKKSKLMLAEYKQKWLIVITQVKQHIYIFNVRQNQYLNYDQQYKFKLSSIKQKKWFIKNAENGLHNLMVQI